MQNLSKLKRELYRDETETPDKIAGLFAKGYISILASPPGAGKTWITELLICQLSLNDQPLTRYIKGYENDTETPPIKTLLLAGETGTEILNQRLAQTAWGYDSDNISIYNALDFAKFGVPYLLNTPEGKGTLWQIMKEENPDLVVIDTLISWHVADENKQDQMVDIYTFIMRIAHSFKCAVLINHHTRKRPANNHARNFNADDIIGSSAGIRLARDVYILNKGENNDIIFEHAKSWDKKISPLSFKIVNDGWKLDIAYKQHEKSAQNTAEKFKAFIDQLADDSIISISQTAAYLNISNQLARHYFNKYLEEGLLETISIGGQKLYQRAKGDNQNAY